jgi:hypothetical protein
MSIQYLTERFQIFLDEHNDNGMMIVDSRKHHLDLQVAHSYLSFIFGNANGKQCNRMIEAPMFTDSRLTAGLQIVDIVGSCLFTNEYYQKCRTIPGALDYSHMQQYKVYLNNQQFHSKEKHGGYYKHGFKYIVHH